MNDIENIIECDCVLESNKEDCYLIENDFGHIHNSYDIEGFKSVWGNAGGIANIKSMERWNKTNKNGILGSKDLAEKACKNLVN